MKYRVSATMNGFDIDEDNMELVVKNRWGRVCYQYKADDFFSDGEGGWFFTMTNVKQGDYTAYLTCWRGDGDFEGGAQRVTDMRHLVSVVMCACDMISYHHCGCDCGCGETEGLTVKYERVWTVNLTDGIYLADCDGNPILDRDGNLIRFSDRQPEQTDVRINMTGDEFRHWMDERDANGRIDTRLEVEDALAGMSDNTELEPMTEADGLALINEIINKNNDN